MKKTNNLNVKIKRYAALATGVTAAAGASAQVTYTDVNPDVVLTPTGTAQYLLNLDGDAAIDMGLVVQSGSVTGIYSYGTMQIPYTVTYNAGAAVFGSAAPSTNGWMGSSSSAPSILSNGNAIDASGTFYQSQGIVGAVQNTYLGAPINGQYGPYSSGNFLGTEGYIGVRFDISGSTHYGWVRVEMAADATSMTIKDYAYDATPNTAIAAGDMGPVGVDEVNFETAIQFISNQNNQVTVKMNTTITNGMINVVSIDGKSVASINVNSQTELVDLSNLSSGIYMVNLTSNEGTITKKFYVR
mgnify:CR=1 FL=1